MNSRAAQQHQQQHHQAVYAPTPIAIADDGHPAPALEAPSKPKAYLKLAAIAAVPLVLGFVVGAISYKNQSYNQTIDDAKVLTDDIKTTGRSLKSLQDLLFQAKERGRDKQDFLSGDKQLIEELAVLKLERPDTTRLFGANLANMHPDLVDGTLRFYGDVSALYEKIAMHVRLSKGDQKAGSGKSTLAKLATSTNKRFGAIFRVSKEDPSAPPVIEIVEVGAPICQDQKPYPDGCPDGKQPVGFQYRPDLSNEIWGSKPWAKSADAISPENLMLLGDNPVIKTLTQGNSAFYEDLSFMARIHDIDTSVDALNKTRKVIEDRMNQKAQEGKRFSL